MQKIIKTQRIAETRFIHLVEDTYLDKEGVERTWVKAQRPNGQHAVVIVPIYKDCLVVTKEYRVPIKNYEWSFPAGLIDPGESPVSTAIRELKEETGYIVDNVLCESPLVYNSLGLTDEGVYMVYAEVHEGEGADLQDSEDISTYCMNREGIQSLLTNTNNCFGAKAWIIFKQFVKTGEVI